MRTDAEGVARFPAMLKPGQNYELLLKIDGNFWNLPDRTMQAGQDEVVVPRLSRVEHITLNGDLAQNFVAKEFRWTALASESQGLISWPADAPSPYLPTGLGDLAVVGVDDSTIVVSKTLAEGKIEDLQVELQTAELRLEWLGPGDCRVTVDTPTFLEPIKAKAFPPGPVVLPLWPGDISLYLEHDNGVRQWSRLHLTPAGMDLGPIGPENGWAGVTGVVLDQDENPLPFVNVGAFHDDLAWGGFSQTDEKGQFEIGGLTPGSYTLAVYGDKAYGGDVAENMQDLFLRPGESKTGLVIHLHTDASSALQGSMSPGPPQGTSAFLSDAHGLSHADFRTDDTFRLPRPSGEDAWVGAFELSVGNIFLTAQPVPEGASTAQLTAPTTEHEIRILTPEREPRQDVRIIVYFRGAPLLYYAMPDADGRVLLRTVPGLAVNIQFRESTGRATVKTLDEVLSSGEVILEGTEDFQTLTVIDLDGKAVPGATAMHYRVGDVYQGDGYGRIHLPPAADDRPYLIDAGGYHPVWDTATSSHEVIMLRTLRDIRLHLSEQLANRGSEHAVTAATLEPLHLPEAAWHPGPMALPFLTDGRTIQVFALPEGEAHLILYDADGNMIAERNLVLERTGQLIEVD